MAAERIDKGPEETLTLHKPGLFAKIGRSFKATSSIERVRKQPAQFTDKVDRRQSFDQRRRWVASAFFEIEPGLNRVWAHEHLKALRKAMKKMVGKQKQENKARWPTLQFQLTLGVHPVRY